MAETYTAGYVTAYGAAVRGGYTRTYEEFCAEQAKFGENAAAVAQAKADVETMQGQVEQAAATFTGTTVPAAVATVQEAGAAQVQAVQDEGTMQAAAVETVGAQQTAAVEAAGSDAVDAVEAAETAATGAVTAAQTAAVQAVQAESTTQQAAIQTKGQETIASIPEDYTALTEEVNDVKSALYSWSEIVNNIQYYGLKAHNGAPNLIPSGTPTYYVFYNSNTSSENYKRLIVYNGAAWAYYGEKTIDDLPDGYDNQKPIDNIDSDAAVLKNTFEYDSGISQIEFTSGYLNTTGTNVDIDNPTQSSSWRHAAISCAPGDIFTINAEGGNSAKPYAFLKSDKSILYRYGSNTVTDKIVTIPDGCAYLIINDKSLTSICIVGKTIKDKLKEIDDLYSEQARKNDVLYEDDAFSFGGIPLGGWVDGAYFPTNGETVNILNPTMNASYRYNVVTCNPGDSFTINATGGASARAYAFIDNNGTILNVLPPSGKVENEVIIAPENTLYLVINDNGKDAMCYKGDMMAAASAMNVLETQITDVIIDGNVGAGKYVITSIGSAVRADPTATDYKRSKIPAREGFAYQIECDTNDDGLFYAYFADSTNKVLSRSIIGSGNHKKVLITAPNGTASLFLMTYAESDAYAEHASVKVFDISNSEISERTKIKNHLTILIFGHSYTSDCWQYVPFILKEYGITCDIYVYYRGNGSIDQLVSQWTDRSDYGKDAYGKEHIRVLYHIDTRRADKWDQAVYGYSAKDILEFANDPAKGIPGWDLITLQTAPTEVYYISDRESPDPRKGYEPYVRKAINLINASYHKPYVLGWFASYTRITSLKANAYGYPYINGHVLDDRVGCLRAAETIFHAEPFDMIIPAAAAVFNARTNASLASTSVSSLGNLWYEDGVHLHGGVPCYVGNLAVCQALFKQFFPMLSVNNNQMRITDTKVNNWLCPGRSFHGTVKANTDDLYELAQKAAVCAVEHPFEITPIYNPNDDTQISAFYDSTTSKYAADSLIDTSSIDPDNPTDYEDGGEG